MRLISKSGSVFFYSLLFAALSACLPSDAVSVPESSQPEGVSYCWEVPSDLPPWQPAEVAMRGQPPFSDAEVENLLTQLSIGRLTTEQLTEVIDQKSVVRLEYLVMGSGDFFSYASAKIMN